MKTIERYKLDPVGDVLMPTGSIPLYVKLRYGEPIVYAIVDNERPEVVHDFVTVMDRHPLPECMTTLQIRAMYLGSYNNSGEYHVFYRGELNDGG